MEYLGSIQYQQCRTEAEHGAYCQPEASQRIDESYVEVNIRNDRRGKESTHIRQKISDTQKCHFDSKDTGGESW
jgi:hypothetical protein